MSDMKFKQYHIVSNNYYDGRAWLSIHHLEAISYVIVYDHGQKMEEKING